MLQMNKEVDGRSGLWRSMTSEDNSLLKTVLYYFIRGELRRANSVVFYLTSNLRTPIICVSILFTPLLEFEPCLVLPHFRDGKHMFS